MSLHHTQQVDEDLTAKLDLPHTRFSFMDNDKVFKPSWMAPERKYNFVNGCYMYISYVATDNGINTVVGCADLLQSYSQCYVSFNLVNTSE